MKERIQNNEKRTWRKFWIPVMMIIALINSSFPVSAHDVPNGGEESSSPYVVCKYCVMGYAVLVCDKTPIYDGSSTHKYNLTKTCTKKYYQANYKGYKCEACGRINPLFGVENGLHDCFVTHSSCGRATEDYCRDGQMPDPD